MIHDNSIDISLSDVYQQHWLWDYLKNQRLQGKWLWSAGEYLVNGEGKIFKLRKFIFARQATHDIKRSVYHEFDRDHPLGYSKKSFVFPLTVLSKKIERMH